MSFVLKLILPTAFGLAAGLLFGSGAARDMAYFSNLFFFAGLCNILYSGALLVSGLGAFKTLFFGISLFFRLLFNKSHPGGKKLTQQYIESGGPVDPIYFWPQAVAGAVFIVLSAVLAALIQ